MGASFRTIILAGLAAVGLYLGYKYLLSEDVKDSIKNMAEKGMQIGMDVHDKVTGGGEGNEKDRIASNQQFVSDQWSQAGF